MLPPQPVHAVFGKSPNLRSGLEVKVHGMETSASFHRTPHLAALGKIAHIVGDHYVGIERVSALPTIALGIVHAERVVFAHR